MFCQFQAEEAPRICPSRGRSPKFLASVSLSTKCNLANVAEPMQQPWRGGGGNLLGLCSRCSLAANDFLMGTRPATVPKSLLGITSV